MIRNPLRLPSNLPNKKVLSIDIGGSLAKAAFYIPQGMLEQDEQLRAIEQESVPIELANGDKMFLKSFKSNNIQEFIDFVKKYNLLENNSSHSTAVTAATVENGQDQIQQDELIQTSQSAQQVEENILHATGGGAFKYTDLFQKAFDNKVTIRKYDEMQSLVDGMYFVLNYAKEPSYTFREGEGKMTYSHVPPIQEKQQQQLEEGQIDSSSAMSDSVSTGGYFNNQEKYKMLVSIGSGVSMIKVSNNGKFQRVSGTMIGGGTLMGLSNLLTGIKDFDQIVEIAQTGDNAGVDMLVKDIYGETSPVAGLQGDYLASSFAKPANDHYTKTEDLSTKYKKEDILHSLIFMISFNIGQLALLSAQIHDIDEIYFVGNYIRNNPLAMEKISLAVDILSAQKTKPLFMTFDGYLGALGAFMQEFNPNNTNQS